MKNVCSSGMFGRRFCTNRLDKRSLVKQSPFEHELLQHPALAVSDVLAFPEKQGIAGPHSSANTPVSGPTCLMNTAGQRSRADASDMADVATGTHNVMFSMRTKGTFTYPAQDI